MSYARDLLRWATVLAAWTLSAADAGAETLEYEGVRFEVPAGFSTARHDDGQFREWFSQRLRLPRYYFLDEAGFRVLERVSEEGVRDVLVVARVPGESRSADDPVVETFFCASVADDHDPALGPRECGCRTTSRGVVGIELRRLARFGGETWAEFLFLLLRTDDLVAIFVELPGSRRDEVDAIGKRLLDSLEFDGALPPRSHRRGFLAGLPQLLTLLAMLVAPALVVGVAWAWWNRRRGRRERPWSAMRRPGRRFDGPPKDW